MLFGAAGKDEASIDTILDEKTSVRAAIERSQKGDLIVLRSTFQINRNDFNIKPGEMTDILQRLKALDAQRGKIPLPKGPVPTSMKGMRAQQRGR